eukprot:12898247-Heterocapsa_arctica.AAC.1
MTPEAQQHYASKALAASNVWAAEAAQRAAGRPRIRAGSRQPWGRRTRSHPMSPSTIVVTPDPYSATSDMADEGPQEVPEVSPAARIESLIPEPCHEPELPELSPPRSMDTHDSTE